MAGGTRRVSGVGLHMRTGVLIALAVALGAVAQAQSEKKSAPAPAESLDRVIALAASGDCGAALPQLQRGLPRATDKDIRYRGYMAAVRCAMSVNDESAAVKGLIQLKHDFPNDPEVLYISTHYYSQLANRSSQELLAKAPNSPQVRRLQAEAFESQQRWDDAIAEYSRIVEASPKAPGIHYRIAQAILAKPDAAANEDKAKEQFQAELAIDPANAPSEFMLGELARRREHWDEAIAHFSKASKLDVGFAEAYLALGMSLAGASRFQDALAPLKSYVRIVPEDPAGHYQLALAYTRVGDKESAAREMALQRQLASKSR